MQLLRTRRKETGAVRTPLARGKAPQQHHISTNASNYSEERAKIKSNKKTRLVATRKLVRETDVTPGQEKTDPRGVRRGEGAFIFLAASRKKQHPVVAPVFVLAYTERVSVFRSLLCLF